jgi:magnesium chelatase family protein
VRCRVLAAVDRQLARAGVLNARLDAAGLREHCHLPADAQALLEMAGNRFALSARALDSARRVARTLADLAGDECISSAHLAEALSLRADRGKKDGLIAG